MAVLIATLLCDIDKCAFERHGHVTESERRSFKPSLKCTSTRSSIGCACEFAFFCCSCTACMCDDVECSPFVRNFGALCCGCGRGDSFANVDVKVVGAFFVQSFRKPFLPRSNRIQTVVKFLLMDMRIMNVMNSVRPKRLFSHFAAFHPFFRSSCDFFSVATVY